MTRDLSPTEPKPEFTRKSLKDWTEILPKGRWRFITTREYEGGVTAERWLCQFGGDNQAEFELAGEANGIARKPEKVPANPEAKILALDLIVDERALKPVYVRMLGEMTGLPVGGYLRYLALIKATFLSWTREDDERRLPPMPGPGGRAELKLVRLRRVAFVANFESPGRL